jgi:hypothetical protein
VAANVTRERIDRPEAAPSRSEGSAANRIPMAVTILIPFSLLWPWRRWDGSDASTLHECYARGAWRGRSFGARAALLARILVWWPISTVALIAACTLVNGAATRRRFGKPVWRQIAEQIHLAIRHSVPPPWYYIFGLWDDAQRKRAHLFILRYETKGAIYRLLRAHLGGSGNALNNKKTFQKVCRDHGLPAPSLLMVLRDGRVVDGKRPLPESDLFVKPVKARGGTGTERWEWIGSGRYRSNTGDECSEEELVSRLAEQSREKPLLVQHRIRNHPDLADVTTGALATARLMTAINEKNEPEVVLAVFRMGLTPDSPVDNFHAGGLVTSIDLATGELGQASGGGSPGMPKVAKMIRCDTHPLTGSPIKDRRLPFWSEAKDLAVRAHVAFPGLPVVGWDIAITSDGPILVEGNSAPDVDLMQVGHQAPIGDTRLAAILAHLVREACAEPRSAD